MGVHSSGVLISLAYRRGLAAVLLLLVAQGANAASIFKCVNAGGAVAFQGTPCAVHAAQTEVNVRGQPLIDPDASAHVADAPLDISAGHARSRKRATDHTRAASRRSRGAEPPVSYECRASDGEVFYRHSKCPLSVRGDGIARFGVDQPETGTRRGRSRSRGGAWGAVSVTSRKIPRSEACRRINAVTAGGRDGHARDEQVSVYEHDLGRDPCRGH